MTPSLVAMVAERRFAALERKKGGSLLMSLAWARLAAPDIGLAEAAIGAGLTGALLLDAYGVLRRRRVDR